MSRAEQKARREGHEAREARDLHPKWPEFSPGRPRHLRVGDRCEVSMWDAPFELATVTAIRYVGKIGPVEMDTVWFHLTPDDTGHEITVAFSQHSIDGGSVRPIFETREADVL